MKTSLLILGIMGLFACPSLGQKHPCHVYVVDVALANQLRDRAANEGYTPEILKAAEKGQKVFPEFEPDFSEERLTTKTFPFPESKLIITASVMSTDESMASSDTGNSLLLGIVLGPSAVKDAITEENNASIEITFNDATDTVRVKKFTTVNRRLYLIGLECHVKERKSDTSK
jgi:hypothetical protein